MSVLVAFGIGLIVGLYGAFNKWSLLKTIAYSLIVNFLVQFLFFLPANATEAGMQKLRKAVVHINIGTGSIVEAPSHNHYLLTNWHVCNSGAWKGNLSATYEDGSLISGKVVKRSPLKDLCVAKVDKSLYALKIAKEAYFKEQVYTRGYPEHILTESAGLLQEPVQWDYMYAIEEVGECFKGSDKVYSDSGVLGGCLAHYVNILTSLYARPGSSGSPVVDDDGNLVGVIDSWHTRQEHEAGIVSLQDVREFFSNL